MERTVSHKLDKSTKTSTNEPNSKSTKEVTTTKTTKYQKNGTNEIKEITETKTITYGNVEDITIDAELQDKQLIQKFEEKGELAVFLEQEHTPFTYITINSFKVILKLCGRTMENGYNYAILGFYSSDIIYNFKNKKEQKPNDYKFDYKKKW